MIALSSPPDRERLVADLLVEHIQFAEINAETDHLVVEIYARPDGEPWVFDPDELTTAIGRGAAILSERLGVSPQDRTIDPR